MTVINAPSNQGMNEEEEEEEYSSTSMVKKVEKEENGISFVAQCKELNEETHFCFVLGYN